MVEGLKTSFVDVKMVGDDVQKYAFRPSGKHFFSKMERMHVHKKNKIKQRVAQCE